MMTAECVADGIVYADRDPETQAYALAEVTHFSVTRNDVTGNVEIWGDHPNPEVDRVYLNVRMTPTAARALARAMIAAAEED